MTIILVYMELIYNNMCKHSNTNNVNNSSNGDSNNCSSNHMLTSPASHGLQLLIVRVALTVK